MNLVIINKINLIEIKKKSEGNEVSYLKYDIVLGYFWSKFLIEYVVYSFKVSEFKSLI